MSSLADQITAELQVLLGEPLNGCWRVADMQIFEFGPRYVYTNRIGDEVEGSKLRIHMQCRWRVVDVARVLFGRDDLLRPADPGISLGTFDWDIHSSNLDVAQRAWFAKHKDAPPVVVGATGDKYGGFRILLEEDFVFEVFPCDSRQGEYSEHWRMLGHRADGSHFVVTGGGVE